MKKIECNSIYRSKIGYLLIKTTEKHLVSVEYYDKRPNIKINENRIITECLKQLDAYFDGDLKNFTINIDIYGTDFQKKVWNEVKNIPYAQTKSYKEIAIAIESPEAYRAVGNANGRNRVPIIIPCHRVIKENGEYGGYSAEQWRKKWLIEHERKNNRKN